MADSLTLAADGGPVDIAPAPPGARYSLRVGEADRDVVSDALGLALPARIGAMAESGAARILCLGPDEWVVVASHADGAAIAARLTAVEVPFGLTDIGDREVTFVLSGAGALDLLATGCPRDLEAIAPGRGVRTVFDGVSIVLWRFADRVEVDVLRSFAPFVAALFGAANREMAAGL